MHSHKKSNEENIESLKNRVSTHHTSNNQHALLLEKKKINEITLTDETTPGSVCTDELLSSVAKSFSSSSENLNHRTGLKLTIFRNI